MDHLLLVTPPATYLVDVPSDAEAITSHRRGEPAFEAAVAAQQTMPALDNQEVFDAWQDATAPAT
ncbi:MAG: hypothetical protein LC635_00065 [Pseudonocardiaceae bacterium]|nr:hypothetical protein [Pseudonocardiaceae bacterium]